MMEKEAIKQKAMEILDKIVILSPKEQLEIALRDVLSCEDIRLLMVFSGCSLGVDLKRWIMRCKNIKC